MKLNISEKNEKSLKFLFKDSTIPFANALRRTMISEVPTLAIEDVHFVKNDSVMYDEVMALRLGLIPLKTNLEEFNSKKECKCEGKGCPSCEVRFTLEKEGECTVYSKDLKSDHKKIVPVNDEIPIVKLGKDKKIKLEAIAILGKGKDHSKWQPGVISYKYVDDSEKNFEFFIETYGQLKPEEIVLKAIEVLESKCDAFSEELKEI